MFDWELLLSLRDGWRYQNGSAKKGGGHFQSKNLCCRFWTFRPSESEWGSKAAYNFSVLVASPVPKTTNLGACIDNKQKMVSKTFLDFRSLSQIWSTLSKVRWLVCFWQQVCSSCQWPSWTAALPSKAHWLGCCCCDLLGSCRVSAILPSSSMNTCSTRPSQSIACKRCWSSIVPSYRISF